MKKILAIAALACTLAGCEWETADIGAPASPWKRQYDKAIQAKAFAECMKVLPAGPQQTVYNDWDEVVDACRAAAADQAVVYKRHVGGGVWVTMEEWAQLGEK